MVVANNTFDAFIFGGTKMSWAITQDQKQHKEVEFLSLADIAALES